MKKKLLCVVMIVLIILSMSACNRQIVDITYSYEKAILLLPNGEIVEGKVQSWKDYTNSDQIQVKINGKQYLIHSGNVVLISK